MEKKRIAHIGIAIGVIVGLITTWWLLPIHVQMSTIFIGITSALFGLACIALVRFSIKMARPEPYVLSEREHTVGWKLQKDQHGNDWKVKCENDQLLAIHEIPRLDPWSIFGNNSAILATSLVGTAGGVGFHALTENKILWAAGIAIGIVVTMVYQLWMARRRIDAERKEVSQA